MSDYRRETDSTGVTVEYRPLSDLKCGDRIAGGWRPWPTITLIEDQEGERRVFYDLRETPTPWWSLDHEFPVIILDPEALADEIVDELADGIMAGAIAGDHDVVMSEPRGTAQQRGTSWAKLIRRMIGASHKGYAIRVQVHISGEWRYLGQRKAHHHE